jgi:cell division protein FtsB
VLDAVEALESRVESLQQQVGELAERQDFTERLIAKGRERGALGSGGQA